MENSNGGEVKINFSTDSERSDPQKQPVIIVGQLTCLNKITFDDVRHKLEPRVTEEVVTLYKLFFVTLFGRIIIIIFNLL